MGRQCVRSPRLQSRKPRTATQMLVPQTRGKIEFHAHKATGAHFLGDQSTTSSHSEELSTSATRHHDGVLCSVPSYRSRGVSLHSRHRERMAQNADAEGRRVAPIDRKAAYLNTLQPATKTKRWEASRESCQSQEAILCSVDRSSKPVEVRIEANQPDSGVLGKSGIKSGVSLRPRRVIGRLLPLFLLALAAFPSSMCAEPLLVLAALTHSGENLSSQAGHFIRRCVLNRGTSAVNSQGLTQRFEPLQCHVAWLESTRYPFSPPAAFNYVVGRHRQVNSSSYYVGPGVPRPSRYERLILGGHSNPVWWTAPQGLSMRRAVRVAAVKPKSRGSIDKRFKVTATGKLLYKRPGLQHHAHTKSSARRARLRRVASLKASHISRLLGPLSV